MIWTILKLIIKLFWWLFRLAVYWFGLLCFGGIILNTLILGGKYLIKCNFGVWIWVILFLASGFVCFSLILLNDFIVDKIGKGRIKNFQDKYSLIIYFFVCLFSIVISYFLILNGFFKEVYGE